MQRLPAFAGGLIVRSEGRGNVRWRTREVDNDFPLQVETREFIEIFLGDLEAVADENQRRGDSNGIAGGAGADKCIVGEGESFRLAVGDESERGFGFIDLILIEADGLIEAVRAGRLEAGFL